MLSTKKDERLERKMKSLSALAMIMEKNAAKKENPESDEPAIKKKKVEEMIKDSPKLTDDHVPNLRLKPIGQKAMLTVTPDERQPLLLDDVQNLLMVSLLKSDSPFMPWRWCHLEKVNKLTQTVVLLVDGLTSYDLISHESLFVKSKEVFCNGVGFVFMGKRMFIATVTVELNFVLRQK